jgi:protease-4
MKQFFKYTLATILGVILAGFILTAILFGIAGGIAGQKSAPTKLKPNSVYELKLNGVLENVRKKIPFP